MYKNNSDQSRLCPAPWQLQGEAYILNYWLSPQFLKQAQPFGLTPSFLGRLVQVMWVRYHACPIGAYGELLIVKSSFIYAASFNLLFLKFSYQTSLLCNTDNNFGAFLNNWQALIGIFKIDR